MLNLDSNFVIEKTQRLCEHVGCKKLCTEGRYCEEHKPKRKDPKGRKNSAQRGYGGAWRKARALFLKLHPVCVICGQPATDVDHIVPHKGDKKIFWDVNNWQPLCHSCHSKKTAREFLDWLDR